MVHLLFLSLLSTNAANNSACDVTRNIAILTIDVNQFLY